MNGDEASSEQPIYDYNPNTGELQLMRVDNGRLVVNPDGTPVLDPVTPVEWINAAAAYYYRQAPTPVQTADGTIQFAGPPADEQYFVEGLRIAVDELHREEPDETNFVDTLRSAVADADTRFLPLMVDHGLITPAEAEQVAGPGVLQNHSSPDEPNPVPANRIEVAGQGGSGAGPLPPTASTGTGRGEDQSDSGGQGTASSPAGTGRTGGDPLVLFSGQFYHQVTDLEVAGRGLHFAFMRTYLHQTIYKGPLGYSWDHSYNLWLREEQHILPDGSLQNVVFRSTGQLREDPYVQVVDQPVDDLPALADVPDAVFEAPPGFFDRLEKADGRYILETVTGVKYYYNDTLSIERIVDLNGNEMAFDYTDGLLTTIRDPVGKEFMLTYDEMNRIAQLHDLTGNRTSRYTYSDNGDLEEVDAFLEPDLIAGTDYRYLGPDQPIDLQHNLIEIISPRGQSVLANEYGTEPGTWNYNRIVRQRSDDGEYRYEYGPVFDTPVDPGVDALNAPLWSTQVFYPNNHCVEHWFNIQGNIVRRDEQILGEAGVFEQLIATYQYNEDGLLIREVRPDGGSIENRYQRDAYAELHDGDVSGASLTERLAFGNLLRRVVHPRNGFGEERRIVTLFTYYPLGNRLASERGPYYADALLDPLPDQPVREVFRDYDDRGNLVAMRFSPLERADGTVEAPLPYRWVYGPHGQVTDFAVGPVRTHYTYFDDVLRSGFVRERVEDTDGEGRRTQFEVDALGRITQVIDPLGGVTELSWATFDAPLRIRTPQVADGIPGPVTTYRYDRGRLLIESREEVQLPDGSLHPDSPLVRTFSYDAYGRPREQWVGPGSNPGARQQRTIFNGAGVIDREVDAAGTFFVYYYDERLLLSAVTRGWGTLEESTRRIRYNWSAEPVESIDGRGYSTSIDRDAFGRARAVRDPDENEFITARDATGRITRQQVFGPGPDGGARTRWAETQTRYDAAGRVIETIDHIFVPGGPDPDTLMHTRYFYDSLGRLERVEDELGAVWTYQSDGLGRLRETNDPDGNRTTLDYEDSGRIIKHRRHEVGVNNAGIPVTEVFEVTAVLDRRGLAHEVHDSLDNVLQLYFDSRCGLVQVVDATGQAFTIDRDIFGQELQRRSILNGHVVLTKMAYDVAGRPVELTSPIGGRMVWSYDTLGRLTRSERQNDGIRWQYDQEDNVVARRDESGTTLQYTYTPGGRLQSVLPDSTSFVPPPEAPRYRPSDASPSLLRYTPLGTVAHASNEAVSVSFRYNSLGLPVEERTDLASVQYGYDALGRFATFTFPDGRTIHLTYSPGGRLTGIDQVRRGARYPGDPAAPEDRALARIQRIGSRPSTVELYGGQVAAFEYDAAGRTVAVDWGRLADDGWFLRERILYGPRGEQRVRQLGDQVRACEYDGLARLVRVTEYQGLPLIDTGAIGAFVEGMARPVSQADVNVLIARTLDDLVGRMEMRRYVYNLDDNSNRLSEERIGESDAAAVTVYVPERDDRYQRVGDAPHVYDGAGNLLDDGRGNQYRYDALQHLTEVMTPGGNVSFTFDPLGRVFRRRTPDGTEEYVYSGSRLVEWRAAGSPAGQIIPFDHSNLAIHVAAAGKDWTPVCDALDSVHGWVSGDGGVSARRRYDPFGRLLEGDPASWPILLAFAGYHYESLPGTYRLPARTYDPNLGRFTQLDPLGLVDGTNMYAFARHAPGSLTDYSGLSSQDTNWRANDIDVEATYEEVFKGIGALAIGIAFPPAGLALALGGAFMLGFQAGQSYATRRDEAMRAGQSDAMGRIALATMADTVGVSGLIEGSTGRTMVSGRRLTGEEIGRRFGEGLVGVINLGAGAGSWLEGRVTARSLHTAIEESTVTSSSPAVFRSSADPIRALYGPGRVSHPAEWAQTLAELENMKVTVEERPGTMAYSPSWGEPGKILLDPDASIAALRHEYQHARDDRLSGWRGMGLMRDPWVRWTLEYRGYRREIRFLRARASLLRGNRAQRQLHFDTARQVVDRARAERESVTGLRRGFPPPDPDR